MNFELNQENLKKPMTWAVIIPIVLLLATLYTGYNLRTTRTNALNNQRQAKELYYKQQEILRLRKSLNIGNKIADVKEFHLASFIIENARESDIPEENITTSRMTSQINNRDNTTVSKQAFTIRKVDMYRLAKFITKAKMAYADLDCVQIQITRSRSLATTRDQRTSEDSWDVNLNFEYITEN